MSNDSWYQRAMARARGTEPPRQQQPVTWSNGSNVNTTAAFVTTPNVAMQFQAPSPGPPPTGQKQAQASTSQLLRMQAETGSASPGLGHQLNPNACPQCGNSLFYERLTRARRGPEPAPHCFTCGYNGLFEQGLESSWAS